MNPHIENVPEGLVYLSMPYTHSDPSVRELRMETFWVAAAKLIDLGVHAISPMSMEPTLDYSSRGDDWSTWQLYCNSLMAASDEIWVLKMEGWEKSLGVAGEIAYAREHGKPVRYLNVDA